MQIPEARHITLAHAPKLGAGTFRPQRSAFGHQDLNQPVLTREVSGLALGTVAPLTVAGIPAAMSGLKPAEDGTGLVFRVYEPAGRRGDFAVTAPGWSTEAVTIMEEPQIREASIDLMPFEVRSWKLTK